MCGLGLVGGGIGMHALCTVYRDELCGAIQCGQCGINWDNVAQSGPG